MSNIPDISHIPRNQIVGDFCFVPHWDGGTPEEQGFHDLEIPNLKRINNSDKEYHVYTTESEFTSVSAETAIEAIELSKITNPYKVVHANCRLDNTIDESKLERISGALDKLLLDNIVIQTQENPPANG